jgi:hypothetical protein
MFEDVVFRRELSRRANTVDANDDPLEDMGFVLFLEAHERGDWSEGVFSHALGMLITAMTPVPNVVHAEILVPPSPDHAMGEQCDTNFATYIGGSGASWQNDDLEETVDYYIKHNGGRWRALPVVGRNARERARKACNSCNGAPYSICRYLTSLPFFREVGERLLSKTAQSPGHCATIAARVISASRDKPLPHAASYYSPSSLYQSVASTMAATEVGDRAGDAESTIRALVREPLSAKAVQRIGDTRCARAVRELAARCLSLHASAEGVDLSAGSDVAAAEHALACALLRWTLMRAVPF